MKKILRSSTLFLILTSIFGGCAAKPVATHFDGKWQFVEAVPGDPPLACLKEPDVMKLRELLIRCPKPEAQ